ncbi:MAG: hypothetical protein HYV02_07545 [Deltaproteobacteria bacterium]|nr:hypothetical protein [Deltaproteobacteria bacterium]
MQRPAILTLLAVAFLCTANDTATVENQRRVEHALRARIAELLPRQIENQLYERLHDAGLDHTREEIASTLAVLSRHAHQRLDAQFDRLMDAAYAKWQQQMPLWSTATGLSAWIDRHVTREGLQSVVTPLLDDVFDAETTAAITAQLRDILAGNVPGYASTVDRLERQLQEATDRGATYLPGAQWMRVKEGLLGRTIMTLPNQIYGAILSGAAARHFAQAFCGPGCFNAHEFTRGKEVVEVLLWQLRHREQIALSLKQLLDMTPLLQELGLPAMEQWGPWGEAFTTVRDRLDTLEQQLRSIDALYARATGELHGELERAAATVRSSLTALQTTLLAPVATVRARLDHTLADVRQGLHDVLPSALTTLPTSWAAMKERLGLSATFLGQWGRQTPLTLLGDWPAERVRDLWRLNLRVSGWMARRAVGMLDALGLLGPSAVMLGVEWIPARHPSATSAFDPVLLHNGEFRHQVVDLVIPARGVPLQFVRTYRSRHDFFGPLGRNWTHNYHEQLLVTDAAIVWLTAEGEKHRFARDAVAGWRAPRGVFLHLIEKDGEYLLHDPGGMVTRFLPDGRLAEHRDPFGNRVVCRYDDRDRLIAVADTDDRRLQFNYDARGRLTTLTDWKGRRWHYTYDRADDLTAVRSPGTPEFPEGHVTRYRYAHGLSDPVLNHNLIAIVDPRGAQYLENQYGTTGLLRDRVTAQRYGTQSQTIRATYHVLRPAWWAGTRPVLEVLVTDRRGVISRYRHNAFGEVIDEAALDRHGRLRRRQQWRYDREGRRVSAVLPDGQGRRWHFCAMADRREGGNVCREEWIGTDASRRAWAYLYLPASHRLQKMTDPLGRVTQWHHVQERCVEAIDPEGHVTRFRYNDVGDLVAIVGPLGMETVFGYSPHGDLVRIIADPHGVAATTTYAYDAVGNVIARTDPEGFTTRYAINARNQVVAIDLPAPLAVRETYRYDANDNLTDIARHDGRAPPTRIVMAYDTLDHLIERRLQHDDGAWSRVRYRYDANEALRAIEWPEGNRTEFFVDMHGRRVAVRHGAGEASAERARMTFDEAGRVAVRADGRGVETRYQYDPFGALAAMVWPNGSRRRFERDAAGNVIAERWDDPHGGLLAAARYAYDANDALIAQSRAWWTGDPGTARWVTDQWIRDARGQVVQHRDAMGTTVHYRYDALGRLREYTSGSGVRVTWEYDRRGLPIARTVAPPVSRREWTYDSLGRSVTMRDPLGGITHYAYNHLSQLTARRDPSGRRTTWTFDRLGRPSSMHDITVTHVAWDRNGRLASLTDGLGHRTSFTYDSADRLQQRIWPNGAEMQYGYDLGGRLRSYRDPLGQQFAYRYDAMGSLIHQRVIPAESGSPERSRIYRYDALGLLQDVRADDGAATVTFAHDSLGQRIEECIDARCIRNVFDPAGHVVQRTFPGGSERRAYDADGRLVEIETPGHRVRLSQAGWQPRREVMIDDTLHLSRTYDLAGQIVAEAAVHNGELAWGIDYTYDQGGNIIRATRQDRPAEWRYAYDPRGMLSGAQWITPTATAQWGWTYDDAGNRRIERHDDRVTTYIVDAMNAYRSRTTHRMEDATAQDGSCHGLLPRQSSLTLRAGGGHTQANSPTGEANWVGVPSKPPRQRPPAHATRPVPCRSPTDIMAEETFHFDANGNLRADAHTEYSYDPWNHLTALVARHPVERARTPRVELHYDALGRRIGKDRASWLISGETVVAYSPEPSRPWQLVRGTAPDELFLVNGLPVVQDRHFTPQMVLANNAVQEVAGTDPFGNVMEKRSSGTAPPPPVLAVSGFSGRPEVTPGLIDMRHRDYLPRLGRFVVPDSLGEKMPLHWSPLSVADGSHYHGMAGHGPTRTHQPASPQGGATHFPATPEANRYLYARNNPLRYQDPLGLMITMERDEATLAIAISVEVTGEDLAPELAERLRAGLQLWEGRFPRGTDGRGTPWQVTVSPDIQLRQTRTDLDRHHIQMVPELKESVAYVRGLGGTTMVVGANHLAHLPSDEFERVIAHEGGHWFGLPDQYARWGSRRDLPRPGYDTNLMGCTNYHCVINGGGHDDIEAIYRNYRAGQLNRFRERRRVARAPYKG